MVIVSVTQIGLGSIVPVELSILYTTTYGINYISRSESHSCYYYYYDVNYFKVSLFKLNFLELDWLEPDRRPGKMNFKVEVFEEND